MLLPHSHNIDSMATQEYQIEAGSFTGVPRLVFYPESHYPKFSSVEDWYREDLLWGKLRREHRFNDAFLSEFLGVGPDGVPFYDADGGVLTHRVRIVNGSPLLLEP